MESISFSSWIQLTTQQHCGVRTHEKFGDFMLFLFAGQPKKNWRRKNCMAIWRRRESARISEWLTTISWKRVAHVNTIHVNSTYVFHINFLQNYYSSIPLSLSRFFCAMRKRFLNENIHARRARRTTTELEIAGMFVPTHIGCIVCTYIYRNTCYNG